MKSIYFVHLYNDYSGSPKILKDVLLSVDREKNNIFLITSLSEGFLSFWEGNSYKYNYKPNKNKILMFICYFFVQLKLFFYLLLSLNKGDVVYINTILPFGASLAAKLRKCDCIYHVHETYIKPKLLMRLLTFFVNKSTDIIYVSNYVSSFYKIDNKKNIHLLYNSVTFPETVLENNIIKQKKEFKCLMVCSLKKYKGILEFINIATNLLKENNIKFTLQLSADKSEIKNFFVNINVPNNVEIRPVNNDLSEVYKEHDLLLNCTKSDECIETFGLTIIEAMWFGLPCIVPKVGGPSEIVTHNVTGYCIDSKDTDAISQKILTLSKDENRYNFFSKNASLRSRDFCYELFSRKINLIINRYNQV